MNTLSPSQVLALKKIQECKSVNLLGPAGSGKTTTITRWISGLSEMERDSILFLAPTHKAISVIQRLSQFGTPIKTVSSFLGYQMTTNPMTLVEEFRPRGSWVLRKDTEDQWEYQTDQAFFLRSAAGIRYLIVDESSMLTKVQVEELVRISKPGIKLILTGDPYQLPPVGESLSFPCQLLEGTVELTEQHRASNHGVQSCFDYLRKVVQTNGSSFEGFDRFLGDETVRIVKTSPRYNGAPITLSWTNQRTRVHNQKLRECYIGAEQCKNRFVVGDKLVTTRQTIRRDGTLGFPNGREFIVTNIVQEEYTCKTSPSELPVTWKVLVIHTGEEAEQDHVMILDHSHKATSDSFYRTLRIIKKKIQDTKGLGKKKFLSLLETLRALGETDSVVEYGYALTVHKSQGSTYEKVAVDVRDILRCPTDEKWRLLYVACTRAQKEINLIL